MAAASLSPPLHARLLLHLPNPSPCPSPAAAASPASSPPRIPPRHGRRFATPPSRNGRSPEMEWCPVPPEQRPVNEYEALADRFRSPGRRGTSAYTAPASRSRVPPSRSSSGSPSPPSGDAEGPEVTAFTSRSGPPDLGSSPSHLPSCGCTSDGPTSATACSAPPWSMRRRDGTMGKRDVTLDPSNMANLQMFSAVIELRYEVSSSLPSNTHEDKLVLVASKLTGTSSRAAFLLWVKTPEVLARDRLLGSFSVKPVLNRVKFTLVGLAVSLIFCILLYVNTENPKEPYENTEGRAIPGVYSDTAARSFEPDAFCGEPDLL